MRFCPGRSVTDQIFALQQFSRNLGSIPSICVVDMEKAYNRGFLGKSFRECCGSTVLTAAFIGRQVIVFVLRRLCPH